MVVQRLTNSFHDNIRNVNMCFAPIPRNTNYRMKRQSYLGFVLNSDSTSGQRPGNPERDGRNNYPLNEIMYFSFPKLLLNGTASVVCRTLALGLACFSESVTFPFFFFNIFFPFIYFHFFQMLARAWACLPWCSVLLLLLCLVVFPFSEVLLSFGNVLSVNPALQMVQLSLFLFLFPFSWKLPNFTIQPALVLLYFFQTLIKLSLSFLFHPFLNSFIKETIQKRDPEFLW